MGTWMHETGAQWLMTDLDPRPAMVASVRMCMAIPVFCLALPAGVWADRCDKRQWLMATQMGLLVIASLMGLLTWLEIMNPWTLLALTAVMGVAMILNQPAWQSLTPELVPPALIPSAVSVGSISFNLARSLGPLMAGLLIAAAGVWCTFLFNACSFLAVIIVLMNWRAEGNAAAPAVKPELRQSFFIELTTGLQVVRRSPELRNTFIRLFFFALTASILWSLLSLVATQRLGFQERGFGLCLGVIGAGAVMGGTFVPVLRMNYSSERLLLVAQIVFGGICVAIGLLETPYVVVPLLVIVGTCWMATMTTLNATAQVFLPREYRARGMAAYIMSFALGMALGSLIWGWLGHVFSVGWAYVIAGASLILVAVLLHGLPIGMIHNSSLHQEAHEEKES